MEIQLTKEHIERAVRRRKHAWEISTFCPIAQAVQEALGDSTLRVAIRTVHKGAGVIIGTLSPNAREVTVLGSEEWGKVEPFTFTYTPVEEVPSGEERE